MTDHGQRRQGVVATGVERRAHRAQWFDDTSHRTASQRRVAVEDRGQRQAGEHARRSAAGSSRSCRSRGVASGSVSPSAPGETTR